MGRQSSEQLQYSGAKLGAARLGKLEGRLTDDLQYKQLLLFAQPAAKQPGL
jgi:hypothetical protein